MSDEEKKDDAGEDDKEEEEKEGEEGEEEDDMDDDGDGDAFDAKSAKNFPPQAREWSTTHFGTPEKASLWQYAEKRSPEDIQQMDVRRKWQVEVRNIRYSNLDEISDIFVQFQVGHDFKLKKKFDRPRGGGGKAKAKAKREYSWVETGTQGQTLLTNVIRNVDINSEVTFASRFKTSWLGSYFDLYQKMLHLEIWDWNKTASNNFVAEEDITLVSIARGAMTQRVDVFGMFSEPGKRKKMRRQVGTLSFVCIFQEVVTFDIKFLDWEATIRAEALETQDEKDVSEISYTTVAKFDLNKTTRSVLQRRRLHRVSRTDQQSPGAVDTVRAHYSVPGSMTLVGVRNDIEDSVLDVAIAEQSSLGITRREACFTRIPLKGVTMSGFMQSQMGYYYTYDALKSNGGRETRKELKQAGDIKGQVDVSVPLAPLWKEFMQVGDLNPPELRDYSPYNYTYLAVKLVRATALAAADESGLSDPYVVVEWGGQRSETIPKRQTLDPVYNETSYFHVRSYQAFPAASDLAKFPYVTITVWDYDESGVSEPLGSTKLYLHNITGSERDGRVVSQVPLARLKVNRRKSWWNPRLAEFEARTRVFRGRLPITHKDPMVKSSVQVEAWFRGPPQPGTNIVDMMEKEDRRRRLFGDLLLLPHFDQEAEHREKVLCLCFAGKDLNGMRKVCDSSLAGVCDCVRLFENDVKARGSEMGQTLLDVATAETSYNALVARPDGELVLRALPTFVQVLVPPKDMFSPDDTPFMEHEEAKYRPNTAHAVFDFVCTMEFAEGRGQDGQEDDGPLHLVSPNFLLDARRGLFRDHVLLLCNLFLGIGLDAYVCIGTAVRRKRSDPTQTEEVEHWWVMTREDHNACLGEAGDDLYANGGAVRFYDVLTQRVVSLRGRWDGQDPDTWGQGLTRKKKKKKKRVVVEDDDSKQDDGAAALEALEETEDLDEDDILQMVASQADTTVQVTNIFLDGAGMGDGWGRVPQHMVMRAQEMERAREREAGAEAARKAKEEELARMKATPAYKRRIAELDRILTTEPMPTMAYRSLRAVFNPKNLWFNVTRKKQSPMWDPARLTYDFERGFEDFAWMPLVHPASREVGAQPVSFYPVRGLSSRLSEDRVEELQQSIMAELDSGIVNVRNALNMRTRMAPALVSPIQDVLIAKHELHLVAHTTENGWDYSKREWVKDTKLKGYRALVRYKQALQKLATTTPPQHAFRIGFCRVNATEPTTVRKMILKHHWGKTKRRPHIHVEEHDGKEMFAIGCKVFPMFNQLACCRVCVMVVFPEEED